MSTPLLFQPIGFRSVTARNRIVVAPMYQYSVNDGLGDDRHVQHLGDPVWPLRTAKAPGTKPPLPPHYLRAAL